MATTALERKKVHRKPAGRRVADDLMEGLREMLAVIQSGKRPEEVLTVRTIELVEPGRYDRKAVRKLRDRMGLSQAMFARVLSVSTVLVQSWEQGKRVPAPMARRLLDEVSRDPLGFVQRIIRRG